MARKKQELDNVIKKQIADDIWTEATYFLLGIDRIQDIGVGIVKSLITPDFKAEKSWLLILGCFSSVLFLYFFNLDFHLGVWTFSIDLEDLRVVLHSGSIWAWRDRIVLNWGESSMVANKSAEH